MTLIHSRGEYQDPAPPEIGVSCGILFSLIMFKAVPGGLFFVCMCVCLYLFLLLSLPLSRLHGRKKKNSTVYLLID